MNTHAHSERGREGGREREMERNTKKRAWAETETKRQRDVLTNGQTKRKIE